MKRFFPLCLFLLLGGYGFSVPLEELLGAERAGALRAQEKLSEVQLKDSEPRLLPRHDGVRRVFEEARTALGPGLLVETLFLYKKPAGAVSPAWSPAERTGLYNRALGLSTLTGLQYYSTSRRTMRTLYEISELIDGPETKRPQPDPVYAEPPARLSVYARQKDLSFGDNVYRYDYYAGDDTLVFIQQNLSALSYGIIPAVGKNNLRSLIAVIDAEDRLLIYAASLAKAAAVPGMGQRIGDSFTTRAEAVVGWLTAQADKVFPAP